MEGLVLSNGSTKNKRRELDFYPTPPDVTAVLLTFLNLPLNTKIWEPACGDGAMAEVIMECGYDVISSDIRHTGYGEGGIDFLTAHRECDAIITNPPFSESQKFINHAIGQADIVAMFFKSQYWHAAKRKELFDEHPPAYVLPLTWRPDFMNGERGGAPTMDVLWTVWIEGTTDTRYRLLEKQQNKTLLNTGGYRNYGRTRQEI